VAWTEITYLNQFMLANDKKFQNSLFFLNLIFCHQDIVAQVKLLVNYTIDNGLLNN
jgi:hypothetical protein